MQNKRKCFGFWVIFALCASTFPLSNATALNSNGQWDFCAPGQSANCITRIVITSTEGVETTFTTRDAASAASVEYRVICTLVECDGSPTMKQLKVHVGDGCKTTLGLGLNRPQIRMTAGVRNHPTWGISIEVNTGTFDPVFSLGKGTLKTQRTENSDGTFSFTWSAKPVVIANVSTPASIGNATTNSRYFEDFKEFYSTAVATTVVYEATINILPATQFLIGNCILLPFAGGWAEANAPNFMFGADFSKIGSDPTKQIFPFSAYAAHFIPGELMSEIPLGPWNGPLPKTPTSEANRVVNPARVQMFMPSDYLKMLGYEDLSTFTVSSFSIQVEDNQKPSPSFVIQNGGVLIDFGISHYSAPNPSLSVLVREKSVVTSAPSTQVFAIALTKPKSAKSLAKEAKLTVNSSSKVSLKVVSNYAKNCKVFGSTLRGVKAGSCKVIVTVSPKKGKATSKTVMLEVSK